METVGYGCTRLLLARVLRYKKGDGRGNDAKPKLTENMQIENIMSENELTSRRIGNAWSSVRGILEQEYSTKIIKGIVGKAGLPLFKIQYDGTHKGPFLDEADKLVRALEADVRDSLVVGCIEEIINFEHSKAFKISKHGLSPDNQILEGLGKVLARAGYGLNGSTIFPLNLQLDIELTSLPKEVSDAIVEALRRYRDGRFAGSVTSICGAVDQITERVFLSKTLGDHKAASFQERISKSFAASEAEYCNPLQLSGVSVTEVRQIWENHKKSVSQSAYVLGAFRRLYSDAHGQQNAPRELVQKSLDCAVFILRSFSGILK